MPNPDHKFKKHKMTRMPSGKAKRVIVKKKTSKHTCALCGGMLHGMPHGKRVFEIQKMAKTERHPSNLLASMICPTCRQKIYLEAVMFKHGVLTNDQLDMRFKKYINMIINKIE
jgi:large subunit ribosomal protein L34e